MPAVDDGERDFASLTARIAAAEARLSARPADHLTRRRLLALLTLRAQIAADPADHRSLRALATEWLELAPASAEAHHARAEVHALQHEFAAAQAELARAEALGLSASAGEPLRASIDLATGKVDAALARARATAAAAPSAFAVGTRGVAELEAGLLEEAEASLREAMALIRDVAPFPVAWLLFQQGRVHELRGNPGQARRFHERAAALYPAYADATAHYLESLAASGERPRAAALAKALAAGSGRADHLALCAALCGAVDAPAATAAREAAARAYDALLADLGPAYWDHAARFYLSAGADPARALALARQNLAARQGQGAVELALEAALAAADAAAACELARAQVSADAPRRLQFLAWRAYTGCGDEASARAVGERLGITAPAPR